MWTILTGVSVFVLYTSMNGSAQAQLIYLQDNSLPPVLSYLNKFLNLQPKWSTSPAYSVGNKKFFEWFRDKIADLPSEDHLKTVAYTVDKLEAMSTSEVKKTYNLDKNIAIAILEWIHDMAEKDGNTSDRTPSETSSSRFSPASSETTHSTNSVYKKEVKEYQWDTYYIYTFVKQESNIKQADFHNNHWSFYTCIYDQCNKVAFPSSANPTDVYVSFANGVNKVVSLEWSYTSNDDDDADEKNIWTSSDTSTDNDDDDTVISEDDLWEEDLLQELSDLFGGIL